MTYKERLKQEQLIRGVKRSIYTEMIATKFEKQSFEEMAPLDRLEIMSVIERFRCLQNRFES